MLHVGRIDALFIDGPALALSSLSCGSSLGSAGAMRQGGNLAAELCYYLRVCQRRAHRLVVRTHAAGTGTHIRLIVVTCRPPSALRTPPAISLRAPARHVVDIVRWGPAALWELDTRRPWVGDGPAERLDRRDNLLMNTK